MAFDAINSKKYLVHQLDLSGIQYQIFDSMSDGDHPIQVRVDVDRDGSWEWKPIGKIKMLGHMHRHKFGYYEEWIRNYEKEMITNAFR